MSYNEKSDIWSLGCLLYELCALRPPFLAGNQKDLAVKICCGTFARLPRRYSEDLNSVIAFMLQVEVKLRLIILLTRLKIRAFQGTKRPSIDDLLLHPLIVKKRAQFDDRSDRLSIASNDEMSARAESLKRLEERLNEREEKLKRREEDLKHREQTLEERERSLFLKENEVKGLKT